MATLPTTRTWVANTTVTAAQMNSDVRDLGKFVLGGSGIRPLCLLSNNAGLSTTNAGVDLTWDVETADYDNGHASSSASYVAQTAGYYNITVSPIIMSWLTSTNYTLKLVTTPSGGSATTAVAETVSHQAYPAGTTYLWIPTFSTTLYLASGDAFKFQIATSNNTTLPSSATASGYARPTLSIQWVSQ